MPQKKPDRERVSSKNEVVDDSILGSLYSPVCAYCEHWNVATKSCAAFKEIPSEIWQGRNYHVAPYPGDGGIQFEFVSGVAPQVKVDWIRHSNTQQVEGEIS